MNLNLKVDAFISIHAPREGCDQKLKRRWLVVMNFNPRTP